MAGWEITELNGQVLIGKSSFKEDFPLPRLIRRE